LHHCGVYANTTPLSPPIHTCVASSAKPARDPGDGRRVRAEDRAGAAAHTAGARDEALVGDAE
jgi:hypothetical protein